MGFSLQCILGSMALLPVHPGWEGFPIVVELGVVARRRGRLCFDAAGALYVEGQ